MSSFGLFAEIGTAFPLLSPMSSQQTFDTLVRKNAFHDLMLREGFERYIPPLYDRDNVNSRV